MRTDNFWVVETEDNVFLGQLELDAATPIAKRCVTIYTGFQGRPPVIPVQDVVSVTAAYKHPDVRTIARGRRT